VTIAEGKELPKAGREGENWNSRSPSQDPQSPNHGPATDATRSMNQQPPWPATSSGGQTSNMSSWAMNQPEYLTTYAPHGTPNTNGGANHIGYQSSYHQSSYAGPSYSPHSEEYSTYVPSSEECSTYGTSSSGQERNSYEQWPPFYGYPPHDSAFYGSSRSTR